MIDIRQSKNWGKYLEGLGWKNEYLKIGDNEIAIRIRKIPILGSVIKIQRPKKLDLNSLKRITKSVKKYRPLMVKVEPDKNYNSKVLEEFGFEKDRWPLSATKTIHIDLMKSEEELLKKFSKDTRYSIRKAKKNKLNVVSDTTNIASFHSLLKKTGKRSKFYAPKLKDLKTKINAFQEDSELAIAYKNGEPVAGALILIYGGVGYYTHAASTKEGQKLYAPYLVLWNAIKISKLEGCKLLDLEGVYDERFKKMTKSWKSFSVFKSKWGGKVVKYDGSYTKIRNPLLRIIFKFEKYLP